MQTNKLKSLADISAVNFDYLPVGTRIIFIQGEVADTGNAQSVFTGSNDIGIITSIFLGQEHCYAVDFSLDVSVFLSPAELADCSRYQICPVAISKQREPLEPENNAMALQPKSESEGTAMTEAEYLGTEPDSEVRREYIDGRAYAMAGATRNHISISANILRKFGNHLEGTPCEAVQSDLKVKVAQNYLYPDIVVDCNNTNNDGLANAPLMIVEVLSTSTRKRDLTTKLLQYINLPSLQEYVLIEQDIVRIQVLRKKNNWKYEEYSLGDLITFEAIDLTLNVEDIYDRVNNNEVNEYRKAKLVQEPLVS
ncbi:MAG: Uma2 family endonuclease [Methylococcales bacterium]